MQDDGCTRAALPVMRVGGGRLIVYISSIAAHRSDLSGAAYQAGKRGLLGLAHATRLEEKQHHVRTSVVLPGLCRTDLVHRRPTPTPKDDRLLCGYVLLWFYMWIWATFVNRSSVPLRR